jgi:predicted DNA-binding protein (MmcQ/YjbR family)
MTTGENSRLSGVSKICLALPEAVRQMRGDHAAFRVKKKTFAYYLSNHHGDGIVSLACKVLPGENRALVLAQPDRFYLPAYIASRGWVALRLDGGRIDWQEVKDLISTSYSLIAPKRLAALAP